MRFYQLTITLFFVLNFSSMQAQDRPRTYGIPFGDLPTGINNAITDVPGVQVGQITNIRGQKIRTGITAILAHQGNIFQQKVPAAIYLGNGFGKLMGYSQVEELGNLETPIVLTNTLSVPIAANGVIRYVLDQKGNEEVRSVNPLIGETNDGRLNDIRSQPITPKQVVQAIEAAQSGKVQEGNVGAGTDNNITIENGGDIDIVTDDDGSRGILALGGNSGDITVGGIISISDENGPTDDDEDGDLDGPSATGGDRIGILVDGTGAFVGNVTLESNGQIAIEGNQSHAISIRTDLDGSLTAGGPMTLTGDESSVVDVRGNVSGDVTLTGFIGAQGEDTSAVDVTGDIGGAFYLSGTVSVSGYRFNGRPTSDDFLETLDEDDIAQSGTAITLAGSIAGGILFDAPTEVDRGVIGVATISVRGSAPALHITASGSNTVIGEVIQPAIEDDPETEDVDESVDAVALGLYPALINPY